jgi:hypothetical protein
VLGGRGAKGIHVSVATPDSERSSWVVGKMAGSFRGGGGGEVNLGGLWRRREVREIWTS